MTDDKIDQSRGMVIAMAAGLGTDQSISLIAQAVPGIDNTFLMQLAEKGGGWVVLLIVLFFYRRDYQRLTISENEVRRELLTAAQRQAESELKLATAMTANTEVLRSIVAQRNGANYAENEDYQR